MATTVISAIDDPKNAQKLINELARAGFKDRDVEILEGNEARVVAALVERGFNEDDARGYAQVARGGKTLVAARMPEDKAERAVTIMERYETTNGEGAREQGEAVQEIEEEVSVGKRKVATGGVRVVSSVRETPVEETVTLRQEHVKADRQPVDRTLTAEEAETAFAGKTIEMMGTSEEAEITKQARVVAEVSLGKTVEERERTVKDSVRRTEVEIEEIGAKARKSR